MKTIFATLGLLMSFFSPSETMAQTPSPNILFIMADDLGTDAIEGFGINIPNHPSTPTLDALRASGVSYTNTWATPQCTPSRASILSGKYGVKTGVLGLPGHLDLEDESVFTHVNRLTDDAYATAVIGKWHIARPATADHPIAHGADHFEGITGGGITDYYNWEKNTNGQMTTSTEYITSDLTDAAVDWVSDQSRPWLLFLSHIAPHSPLQLPPDGLFTADNPSTNKQLYNASIEAMDHEIGRLLDSMDEATRDNTIIIFIGDNGSPSGLLRGYPNGHGKGSMYEGGLRVPMIISGRGVTRQGVIEPAITQANDLYATIIELCAGDLPGGVHNSYSIRNSLTEDNSIERPYIYADYLDDDVVSWAIRDQNYKLILDEQGRQEFYDLSVSVQETDNLLEGTLTETEAEIMAELRAEAQVIRTGWSCQDRILNGEELTIDDCGEVTALHELGSGVLSIYPNPSSELLHVQVEGEIDYHLSLVDARGQRVWRGTNASVIPISALDAGIYFLRIRDTQTGEQSVERIVVE